MPDPTDDSSSSCSGDATGPRPAAPGTAGCTDRRSVPHRWRGSYGANGADRLPAGIDRYDVIAEWAGDELWAYAALGEDAGGITVADVRLIDRRGATMAAVAGLRLAAALDRELAAVVPCRRSGKKPSAAADCEAICAALGDASALAPPLDARAADYARHARETVPEAEVVPKYRRLWHRLARLAVRTAGCGDVPEGPAAALLARCGEALPEVLRGHLDPLPLLSADGASGYISPVRRATARIVAALAAAALPPTGQCRVLEIGGGNGVTAAAVLEALADRDIEYWFTDPEPAAVELARSRIGAQQFARQDIERTPGQQDIPEAAFDLVIVNDALHSTRDLRAALENVARALAADGRLILLEAAPQGDPPGGSTNLVFGLDERWWRFTDNELRRDYPLLSREDWQALLAAQGFESESIQADPARLPEQTVLLARRRVAERVYRDGGGSAAARCAAFLAVINGLRPDERRVVLLTRGAVGPAVADPAGAALWGMMRSLRLERPDLELRAIDCVNTEWNDALAAKAITTEPELAFVADRRYVPQIGSAPQEASPVSPDPEGWVLVTGAFGGLGRFAAEWLVRRGARRLC